MALAVSLLAGCSSGAKSGDGNGNAGSESPASSASAPAAASESAASIAPVSKITYMLPFNTAEPPREDNVFWKKIEELTGTDVQITWVPDSGYTDKTAAIIASGDMPDVIGVNGSAQYKSGVILNAIQSGLFWDLGPYLKDYPNLNPDNMNPITASNFKIDGKFYGLYRETYISRNGLYYRNDWLQKLNLKQPETMDDLYAMLKAFSENDPDGNNADDTYGLVLEKSEYSFFPVWFGAPNVWGEKDGQLYPAFEHPRYLDALKFLKKLYDERLINQDFALFNVSKANDAINAGKGGAFARNVSTLLKFQGIADHLQKIGTVEGPDGKFAYSENGYIMVFLIPKTSVKTEEHLRQVLAFMDRLASREIQDLWEWGVEGVHYEVKDGLIVQTDTEKFAADRPGIQFIGIALKKDVSPGQYDSIMQMLNETSEANEPFAVGNPAAGLISKTYFERGSDLDILLQDADLKFIMGSIDENGWKSALDNWRKQGGDKVISEFNEALAKQS